MLKAKILKILRPEYFGRLEDSGIRRVVIKSATKPSEEYLLALGLGGYHCRCANDCCGHMQFDMARVERRLKRKEWYVTQHFYINI